MECIIDKKSLQDVLKKIQKCVSSNSKILEIASSVLVSVGRNKVTLKATNYNMYVKDVITDVKVKTEGEAVIPFALFKNLTSKYPADEIHLRASDNNVELVSGKNLFKMPIVDIDFPEEYIVDNEIEIELDENLLKNVFKRFLKVIPDESDKTSITGLNINIKANDQIDFVSTDTFRLYILRTGNFSIKGECGSTYIIPKDMVKYISGILENKDSEIKVVLNSSYIKVIKEELVLKHQLISGSYPDYDRIIPKKLEYANKVDVASFKESINRIKIISGFMIGDGVVKIKTDEENNVFLYSSDMKNLEKLDFKFEHEMDKDFDYSQILDFINDVAEKEISINFNEGLTPVILKDKDIDYMIMPLRQMN